VPRLTNPDGDEVAACPECDVAGGVWKRTHPYRDYDKRFKCNKCGAEFDEVNRRPQKSTPTMTLNDDPAEDGIEVPASLDADMKELIRSKRLD
jgi:predicted RNA-binding Zn-ribbon protein involved in translation (DUF1610 family)